jgi:cobalt-zinc-cadmium resistance protein CzcA
VRAGLIVAVVIPLSMLGALVGMVALGIPGNLMSLGAIDFGLLVDGAVVMVENLFHHLTPGAQAGQPPGDHRTRVGELSAAVARPVFFSVLIILLVYVPVLALGGVEGKMFRPMAVTVICAMLTALLLSLTVVPALCSLALRVQDVPVRPPLLVRLTQRFYPPLLARAVRRPGLVAALALGVLAIGVVLFHRAGSEFVPQLDEGDLVIQTTRAADIGLPAAIREAGRLERALLHGVPEVQQVVSRIGSPAVATDVMGIEQADVFVALRPRAQWRHGLDRDALISDIQRVLEQDAPGSGASFTQPIEMRFNELLAGSVSDVSIGIYGDDLGELQRIGQELVRRIAAEPGATDVRLLAPPAVPVLEVVPRPLDAAQAGFAVADVLDAVQAVRTGIEAGATYDGPVRIPILLRLGGTPSAFTLGQLPLPTGSGGTVPLSWVADVHLISTPGLVNRYNAERRLLVGFNVRGADLGSVVARAQARVAALTLPPGCRLEWGGEYQTLQEAKRRLLIVIPVVLLLIIGVLVLAFKRLRPALVIFTHVPFSSVGGMVALWARGMPVSISAAIGFIALSGVAVLNGVVLMSRVLKNEEEGAAPGPAAAAAAEERARPVLTTALVAALGFIPMMLATGVGAEVQRPLATVVVGGLISSTLLTLVILPTLYPWLAGRKGKETP